VLDADLALLVVNAIVSERGVAQTRVWSETGFLRPASDVELQVAQTRA